MAHSPDNWGMKKLFIRFVGLVLDKYRVVYVILCEFCAELSTNL